MSNPTVAVRLSIEGVGQVTSGVKQAEQSLTGLGSAASQAAQGADRIGSAFGKISETLGTLAQISLAGLGLKQFADMADAVTNLRARLQLATGSVAEAAVKFDQLRDIANRTQQPMQDIANVYLGISRAAADLGAKQSQLVKFTDGVAASLRLSGTSGAAASGALSQLSQMMGGTNVQAQEFNSLVDGAPVLLRAVAANLGTTGVSMGELRQRVLDGKLSTQEFFQAFLKGADDLKAKAEAMPSTIGGAFTVLKNNLTDLVGKLDEQYKVTQKVSEAVLYLAGHLNQFKAIVEIAAIALFTYFKQATLIPAAVGLWVAAKTALTAAFVRFQLAAAISGSVVGTLTTELWAANAATLTLTGSVTKLGALFGVVGAALVGWQIGSILRENFLEAQLAGIAFVDGTLKGWEAVKYGAQVAWAWIADTWRHAVSDMGGAMAGFVSKIADGMAGLGFDKMAEGLRVVSTVIVGSTANTEDLKTELAGLKAGYDTATAAIGAITSDMADEAIAAFNSAGAHAAVADAVGKHAAAKVALSDAQKGYLDGLVKERAKLIDATVAFNEGEAAAQRYRAAQLGVGKAAEALIAGNDALARSLLAGKATQEALNKFTEDAIALDEKQRLSTEGQIKSAREMLLGIEQETELLKLGNTERLVTIALRKLEKEGVVAGTLAYEAYADKIRAAISGQETTRAGVDAAKATAAEWQRTADNIEQGLTDSLFRAFEAGGSFFSVFWQGIKNTIKTTILQPTIRAIMAPVTSGIGSIFGGGTAQAAGGAGGGGSSLLGNAASLAGLAGSLGSFGTAAGFGASALFGGTGLTALSGGASMLAAGSTASGLGMMAGVLGPIAAAAGLLYLGLKNGKKETTGSGVEGTTSAEGFTGAGYADWKKKNGFLRGTKYGRDTSAVSSEVEGVLDAGIGAVYTSVAQYAKALSLPVDAALNFSAQFKVVWGKTEAENKAAIEAAIGKFGDQVAGVYGSVLAPFQKAGEAISATLARLAGLETFSTGLNQLGGVFSRIANLSVDARENMIDLAGGMEALAAQSKSFAENYYNRDELAGLKAKEISGALAGAGITADVSTRDEFRALVEGQNVATEAGRTQLATLLQVADSFAGLTDYLAETGKSLGSTATQAPEFSALGSLFSASAVQQVTAINAVEAAVNRLAAIAQAAAEAAAAKQASINVSAPGGWEVTVPSSGSGWIGNDGGGNP